MNTGAAAEEHPSPGKGFEMQRNHITTNPNMQAALDLAGAGFPVFPVNQAKRPLVKWKAAATTDLGQIRSWFAKWPDAMPAIPTGEASGLAVLDLDRKDGKDGAATIAALGFDPDTLSPVMVETPSGGGHLIFRHAPGLRSSAGQIGPGVDVRAEGGFVVAAGAVNGMGAYRLLSGSLKGDLPPWPEALMAPSRQPREAGQSELTGLPFHVIKAALFALPNDGDTFASRDEWLRIGMALHAESDGSEDGQEAWQKWSSQWPGYDPAATEAAWDSFHAGGGITGWTIIHEAEGLGWRDPVVTHLLWLSDFDDLMTAEEEAEIDALVGGPTETLPKVTDRQWDAPMMQGDKPIIKMHNAILYLGRNVESVLPDLRHNLMTHRDEWRDGEVTDAALVLARTALERLGLKTIGKELVSDAAVAVARFRQYHPIRDALSGVRHDGRPRLDSWLVRHAGAADTPYVRAVGRKFLIQMVARIMQPGCKADHTLVLIGPQRAGKSSLCRLLAGSAYHSDTLPSISGGKDVMEHLQGVWVVELSELAPSRKSDAEDLKAFLTSQVDRFRAAYGKRTESFPRQSVFIGTTNDDEFLRDPTGGRRFWPVQVGTIDLYAFAADRDQLLAEAFAAHQAGESWWLDPAFEEEHARPMQDAARVRDSWADTVAEWLAKPEVDFDGAGKVRTEVTLSDVLTVALGMASGQHTMAVQKRAGDVLRGLGWVRVKSHGAMVWRRAEE